MKKVSRRKSWGFSVAFQRYIICAIPISGLESTTELLRKYERAVPSLRTSKTVVLHKAVPDLHSGQHETYISQKIHDACWGRLSSIKKMGNTTYSFRTVQKPFYCQAVRNSREVQYSAFLEQEKSRYFEYCSKTVKN